MKHLLKLSRKGISTVIFVLLIFTLNIHCGSDSVNNASEREATTTQQIEKSLEELATIAGNPTSNDPAVIEDQLDQALRTAISEIFYQATHEMEENDLTRTMVFDISRYLLKIHDYLNTYIALKSLNFLDLNGDGAADQAMEEFITYVNNFAAIFGNVMDMEELVDYNTEIRSNLDGLLNIIKQIENINNIITTLNSIGSFTTYNLSKFFAADDSIQGIISDLESSIYTLQMALNGNISSQVIPSTLDDMVQRYTLLSEELRKYSGESFSIMIVPLLSGEDYTMLTYDDLATYIDGYQTIDENGENVLDVDNDMMGGLIGILGYFRSLIGSMEPASGAELSHLSTSAGTLTPAFSPDTLEYSILVPRNIASITVTPSVPGNDMDITVNGSAVKSGYPSQPITLDTDSYTTITIAVDDSESGTEKTYTISARRIGDSTVTLSGLTVSTGTLLPAFNADKLDYSVEVDNNITSIQVTPTIDSPFSTITVNGTAVNSGAASAPISLNVGTNLISVVVTAEDETTCTYTITVKRLGSHIADLSAIALSQGTLTPSFTSGTLSYTAEVANAITSLTVTPTTAESHAMIDVNGVAATSGTAVTVSNLLVGGNTIRIVVTAQDGTTTKIYTVTVTRKASSNANLSGLAISQGTLSPTFAAGTTSYSATVANTITSMTVTPRVEDGTATVKVNGTAVASGSASQAISLATGTNTITIAVTAQDGVTVRIYTVTVTRQKSNNAYLSGLYVRDVDLSPGFSSTTTYYDDWIPLWIGGTRVTPTASHPGATIKVNGQTVASGSESQYIDFGWGSNYIYITVTAEDGVTTRTYTVKVVRI
ncbi:MAG: hypothetical protein CVV44_21505 [Spirochaetae bacterium HGW-Spirochaetae-1]|jgi:hypothetical protein|nr:MAG: hypothetical protein CVV44_21505 [Spirochaetae bacterium HGW-Spirochaetae-1]